MLRVSATKPCRTGLACVGRPACYHGGPAPVWPDEVEEPGLVMTGRPEGRSRPLVGVARGLSPARRELSTLVGAVLAAWRGHPMEKRAVA